MPINYKKSSLELKSSHHTSYFITKSALYNIHFVCAKLQSALDFFVNQEQLVRGWCKDDATKFSNE